MSSPVQQHSEETITAAQAAKILNVGTARIRQLIFERKLRRAGYEINGNGAVVVTVYKGEVEARAKSVAREYPRIPTNSNRR